MIVGELLARLGLDVSEFQRRLRDAQNEMSSVGKKMQDIGGKMSLAITTPLTAGLAIVTGGMNELRGDLARLETNAEQAGVSVDMVNNKFKEMYAFTEEADSSVEALSNVLATGFKDADKFEAIMDNLAGAAIRFSDTLKLEGIADGLQETFATGEAAGQFAELLERSGIILDDFNAGLQEAIANGTQEQYVLDNLNKIGLAETYEQFKKNNQAMLEFNEKQMNLQTAMVELGNILLPVITSITEKVTEWINRFNELDPSTKKVILVLGGLAAAVGPLLVVVGTLIKSFTSIFGVLSKLPAAFTAVRAAMLGINPVFAIIAAAVGAAILIWTKWGDDIKRVTGEVVNGVKEWFADLKESISETWENIKEATEKVWSGIKDFFKKLGDEILSIATGPAGWVTSMSKKLSQSWDNMKQAAMSAWNNIKSGISNIWSGITSSVSSYVSNLYSTVKSKLDCVWDYIKSIPSKARQWGADIISGLVRGIKSIHIPRPHFDFDIDYKRVAGIEIPIPHIDVDWYARGTDYHPGGLAVVGELGPELVDLPRGSKVIPNNELTGLGTTINIETMVVRDDRDIERIAQELYKLQQRKARGLGR